MTKKKNDTSEEILPTKKTKGSKGEKRKHQILTLAKKTLISNGTESLILRDIAHQLGITHGNLQYYFPTKNDLLIAIFNQEINTYTESMRLAVAATSTKRARLDAIVDSAITELTKPEAALWQIMGALANHHHEMAKAKKEANDAYIQALSEEIAPISPQLSEKRRLHIAQIINVIMDGLSVQFSHTDVDCIELRTLIREIKVALFALLEAD